MVRATILENIIKHVTSWIKDSLHNAYNRMYGKVFSSVTIHSVDPLYVYLCEWLKENHFDADCKNYRYQTLSLLGKKKPLFGPSYGSYTIKYKGNTIWITVSASEGKTTDDFGSNTQTMETITMSCLGDAKVIQNVLMVLFRQWSKKPKVNVDVKNYDGHYWRNQRSLPNRESGLILAEGLLEEVEKDITLWTKSKEWYTSRDIPYRKGYLFYGPPGTGKTSLVKHLARFLNFDIYICQATALSQENFFKSLGEVPGKTIILIEDIDCLYENRKKKQVDLIDFSSLLNGLDGLVAVENVVLVMTTNNLECLDAALIRPGRIDRIIEIGLCTNEQAQRLFKKFFPDTALELELEENKYSPAQLQEVFLRTRSDLESWRELCFK